MDLNATLLGQMITFAIFVWFTMKFVWPALEKALNDRKKRIADGLIAAEKGRRKLELAEEDSKKKIKKAKAGSEKIIAQARRQATQIMEESRQVAQREKDEIISSGKTQVKQSVHLAKERLSSQISHLVIKGVGQILEKSISEKDHKEIIDKIAEEIKEES